jgi:hypothetical protein
MIDIPEVEQTQVAIRSLALGLRENVIGRCWLVLLVGGRELLNGNSTVAKPRVSGESHGPF